MLAINVFVTDCSHMPLIMFEFSAVVSEYLKCALSNKWIAKLPPHPPIVNFLQI